MRFSVVKSTPQLADWESLFLDNSYPETFGALMNALNQARANIIAAGFDPDAVPVEYWLGGDVAINISFRITKDTAKDRLYLTIDLES